jgi:hypothetical protein
MAAGTRLLITSVLFATLLVGIGGIDATPAAVLAAAAAWLTMQGLDRRAERLRSGVGELDDVTPAEQPGSARQPAG